MADDSMIRRANLAVALAMRGMKAREASAAYGRTVGYWHGLLNGSRSFGEKIARAVEADMSLPRGSLDQIDEVRLQPMKPTPPSVDAALPVVLDAMARAPEQAKLRAALLAMLEDDSPAYRARIAELLADSRRGPGT